MGQYAGGVVRPGPGLLASGDHWYLAWVMCSSFRPPQSLLGFALSAIGGCGVKKRCPDPQVINAPGWDSNPTLAHLGHGGWWCFNIVMTVRGQYGDGCIDRCQPWTVPRAPTQSPPDGPWGPSSRPLIPPGGPANNEWSADHQITSPPLGERAPPPYTDSSTLQHRRWSSRSRRWTRGLRAPKGGDGMKGRPPGFTILLLTLATTASWLLLSPPGAWTFLDPGNQYCWLQVRRWHQRPWVGSRFGLHYLAAWRGGDLAALTASSAIQAPPVRPCLHTYTHSYSGHPGKDQPIPQQRPQPPATIYSPEVMETQFAEGSTVKRLNPSEFLRENAINIFQMR